MAKNASSETRPVDLTPAEIEVLLKACERDKSPLPVYLQAVQEEVRLVEALLRKLAVSK